MGCSVDHAHLHVVPTSALIRDEVDALDASCTISGWRKVKAIWEAEQEHAAGRDYLYLYDSDGSQWVAWTPDAPSQLFRRAIAHSIRQPIWDWKADPQSRLVAATRECLLPR